MGMTPLLVLIIGVLALPRFESADITLNGEKIYKVQNREGAGLRGNVYLTGIGVKKSDLDSPVISDVWRGSATQKWRLISVDPKTALIELRPTFDETCDLSVNSTSMMAAQTPLRWYNRIGISNSIHQWTVSVADGGFAQLRNYYHGKCLQSFGYGEQVGISTCVNSLRQQWLLQQI